MAERYLIDTNAVIKYLNDSFPIIGIQYMDKIIENECIISFISEIELQAWNPLNADDLLIYKEFILGSKIIGINDSIIKEAIKVRKAFKLKVPDAIIAATALTNELNLVSDNDKDFKKIPGLKYFNPMLLIP